MLLPVNAESLNHLYCIDIHFILTLPFSLYILLSLSLRAVSDVSIREWFRVSSSYSPGRAFRTHRVVVGRLLPVTRH